MLKELAQGAQGLTEILYHAPGQAVRTFVMLPPDDRGTIIEAVKAKIPLGYLGGSMKIIYGPPGAVGVKSLQYVSGVDGIGDDADYVSTNLHLVAKPLGVLALGTWAYAWGTKKPKLKQQALAVAIGAFIVQVLTAAR